jgi:hypothetical protein
MDALHAQREHATCLHKRGAHYLVTVAHRSLLDAANAELRRRKRW